MKVLAVEDDTLTLRMLEKYLSDWGYDVVTAKDGMEAWEVFQKGDINLVVTDWSMPRMNGLELIEKIRAEKSAEYSFIILLTGKSEKEEIVEGISKGADDYITKPFDKGELSVRVRAGQRILDLQQKLMEANKKLEKMAVTDPLTGLYNRWAMVQRLRKEIDPEMTYEMPTAFIMADIDHFKKVNDTYGHDAGDEVLKEVANRLKEAYRNYDIICRMGGEEFLVVAPDVPLDHAAMVAERARRLIEEKPFTLPGGEDIRMTCSFGVCHTVLFGKWKVDEFLKTADQALYKSKENGRNQVTVLERK